MIEFILNSVLSLWVKVIKWIFNKLHTIINYYAKQKSRNITIKLWCEHIFRRANKSSMIKWFIILRRIINFLDHNISVVSHTNSLVMFIYSQYAVHSYDFPVYLIEKQRKKADYWFTTSFLMVFHIKLYPKWFSCCMQLNKLLLWFDFTTMHFQCFISLNTIF